MHDGSHSYLHLSELSGKVKKKIIGQGKAYESPEFALISHLLTDFQLAPRPLFHTHFAPFSHYVFGGNLISLRYIYLV